MQRREMRRVISDGRCASPHHEEPPQGGVSNGDFAQDEDDFDVPSTIYLILSEVEGRTTPMQVFHDVCTPQASSPGSSISDALSPPRRISRRGGRPCGTWP